MYQEVIPHLIGTKNEKTRIGGPGVFGKMIGKGLCEQVLSYLREEIGLAFNDLLKKSSEEV